MRDIEVSRPKRRSCRLRTACITNTAMAERRSVPPASCAYLVHFTGCTPQFKNDSYSVHGVLAKFGKGITIQRLIF